MLSIYKYNKKNGVTFQRKGGFIHIIILIIVLLIALGYFGINVKEVLTSPAVQANLQYFSEIREKVWIEYLRGPVIWFWEMIGKPLFKIFLKTLQNLAN